MVCKPTSHWSSLCFISCLNYAKFKNHDKIWTASTLLMSHSTDRLPDFLLKIHSLSLKNYGTLHLALCHCAHCLPLYFLGIQRADSWKPKKTERKWYCILVVWSVPSCHLKCVFKKICSNVIFHNVVKTLKFTGIWTLIEQIFQGSHSECSVPSSRGQYTNIPWKQQEPAQG